MLVQDLDQMGPYLVQDLDQGVVQDLDQIRSQLVQDLNQPGMTLRPIPLCPICRSFGFDPVGRTSR